MPGPNLWIIAGPNGAGKTTFVQQTLDDFGLPPDAHINPDVVTLEYLKKQGINRWEDAPAPLLRETFIQAANDVEERLSSGMLMVTGSRQHVQLHGIPPVTMRPLVADFLSRFIALNADETWKLDLDERYVLPD